jgi:flagellar biosynthesis protein FlhG
MRDQAQRLRELAETYRQEILSKPAPPPSASRRARVMAITSGKGGVGKTNVAVNLAYALIAQGKEVILLDADLGLANVDVLLGTTPQWHLGHAISGERDVLGLLYEAPGGLRLIAGGSGLAELTDLPEIDLRRFIQSLAQLQGEADYLLIDTGAGLSRSVMEFVMAADEVLVVTTPEPTALTDAYAIIKRLVRANPTVDIKLVVNMADSAEDGESTARRLRETVLRFLQIAVHYLGHIPRDPVVQQCVRQQRAYFLQHPRSAAAHATENLARRLLGEGPAPRNLNLFFDRLQQVFRRFR